MPDESVFKKHTLQQIYDEIKAVYQSDNRPWILGFSGGKDSTCMVQLVWYALSQLDAEKRQKKIFVISSDTLVESPKIVEQLTNTLDKMEKAALQQGLPISTNLVRPKLEDTFWVNLIGLGYPAPSSQFRWCTDRLKIKNADRFINERVSEYGEAIVCLGTRKSESGSRQQLMNLYEIKGSLLSRHSKFPQTYVYTPIRDFTTEDVWNYLLQNTNPWGANNRDLLSLYQDANAGECPLVVDTTTPSCGNSRFGCWVCTVVEEDKTMKNLIDNGEEWMQPLLEFREELKNTQNPDRKRQVRQMKRRSGQVEFYSDGSDNITPGPYTLEFRKELLAKLLKTQNKVQKSGPDPGMTLISEDEVHEIQRIWRMEKGDWQNSAYYIYEKETGRKIYQDQEDLGSFGKVEQEILHGVCTSNDVPYELVSRLLNAEHESQGMARHSRIYGKIDKILSEEWRSDIDEITKDLKQKREDKNKFR
jgi:DNA sulfur modification protein DndC